MIRNNQEGYTRFPVSVLARAKIKIAFGQLALLPCSSSVSVLERPSWRVSTSITTGTAMGEAATKPVRSETRKNFILVRWLKQETVTDGKE